MQTGVSPRTRKQPKGLVAYDYHHWSTRYVGLRDGVLAPWMYAQFLLPRDLCPRWGSVHCVTCEPVIEEDCDGNCHECAIPNPRCSCRGHK